MPITADDYNDAIQELGELTSELPGMLGFKIAMAFSKGLIASHKRGVQEAIDQGLIAPNPSGDRPEMLSDRLGYPAHVGDEDWIRVEQGRHQTPTDTGSNPSGGEAP